MNAIANNHQLGALEQYGKLKLDIAGAVRTLLHFAERRKDEMAVGDCRRLLARLAEDRFNLAMVGQFSRGKSSLMNALLGAEKLPTGILPLTSVITTVAYGESERVLLQREGWTFPQEIRLAELPEYVTQQGNPGNEKKVTLAEIQLPHEMLRLGVHFIDTPGIASAIRANTRTTRQFLPEIDAAVLVTSFESPFAETELNFLKDVRAYVQTIFIVVNKQDLLPAIERAHVVEAISRELRAAFDCDFPVFPMSARDALHAKESSARSDLETSGLPPLEAALTAFIRKDKARALLFRTADRAESIAHQQAVSIRISQRASAGENASELEIRLHDATAKIDQARQELTQELRDRLGVEFPKACQEKIPLRNPESEAFLVSQFRKWFWRDGEIAGDAFQTFLGDLSRKLFDASMLSKRQEIDRIFADLTEQDMPRFEELTRKISQIPAELLREGVSSENWHVRPLQMAPLAFRAVDLPVEQFRLPWWFDLIPNGMPRVFAHRHWLRRMPQYTRAFQESTDALLRTAVEDWISDIDRQIEKRIEDTRSQVIELLREKGDRPGLSEIDAIIEHIQEFREMVLHLGEGGNFDQQLPSATENGRDRLSILRPCSICARLERTLWDFMARAQYELSVSEVRQREHASRSGYCPLHTWQYETISSPQGVCAAYPTVLMQFAKGLRTLAEGYGSVHSVENGVRAMLATNASCEVCELLFSEERAVAGQIARRISRNDREDPPLCAYHLHAVLAARPDDDAARRILLDEAQAFEALAEEMQKYVLKHTAVRHHLTTKTESQAALAGLSRLVGSQRVGGPWRIN